MSLAYMAGFFDGEGYLGILKRKRKNWNIEYFLQVSIGQKDGATMDWIVNQFGGHLHKVKRDGSYYWTISNKGAYEFISKIVPFLRYKKPQAELAIEFYKDRVLKRPIPLEELEKRESIYQRMRLLKKEFTIANRSSNVRSNND